jgi:hypothetical protein
MGEQIMGDIGGVTIVVPPLWRRQPALICGVWNVADEGQPPGTWGEITEGSLSKPSYEPEDKANERNRNKWMSHVVATSLT